jgi:hypothetical protein
VRRTRRQFLRDLGIGAGVGLGAASLPLLRSGTSKAAGEFPQRFVVFFTPNGTIRENWTPSGGETDFTLSTILEPLAAFRDQLIVLDGLDMKPNTGPGDGHQMGMGHMLTGVELLPGDTMGGCDSCPPVSWANGISIDQAIANQIGEGTRFRSLELGVRVGGSANVWTRMCYRAASEPLPPDSDPYSVFERVFGELDADPFGLERRRELRRSVVDFVNDDFTRIRSRLGGSDLERFQSHVEGVAEIERRLTTSGTLGAACEAPMMGERLDVRATDNYPTIGQLQMDQLAMALACDLTRVGSIQWTNSVGQVAFPWLGIPEQHHDLSHEGDSNTAVIDKLTRINRWYSEQLAYLLDKLAAIPEGEGTLLDNTCVMWINELGRGNSHTRNNIPIVLAGGAGGALRTGRSLSFADKSHCDLLTTLGQAYGLGVTSFGDPRHNSGAMTGLLA